MELTLEQRREQRVLFEKALPVAKQAHWYDHNCTYGDAYVDGRWRSWCDAVEVNMPSAPETKPAITGELNNQYAKNVIAGALQALVAVGDADQLEGHRTRVLTRLQNGELGVYETAEYAERVKAADAEILGLENSLHELRTEANKIVAALDAAGVPDGTVLERVTALVAVKPVPEVLDWPDGEGPGFWWIKRSGFPAEVCHVLTYHTLLVMDTGKYTRDDVAANGWQFIRATPPVFPGSAS